MRDTNQNKGARVMKKNGPICYTVKKVAVENFLSKYYGVENSMDPYLGAKTVLGGYISWLKKHNPSECNLFKAREKTVSSPHFGTKTFLKYEWNGCSGWAEVFQYLYDKEA